MIIKGFNEKVYNENNWKVSATCQECPSALSTKQTSVFILEIKTYFMESAKFVGSEGF
jgi:hypothetical protein